MHVCEVLPKEDHTLPFVAINMMDRYYQKVDTPQPSNEVQLTGLTALFMASKYFEITPIFLKEMARDMSYGKFKQEEFLARETELMAILECNIDPPNHFDFAMLYYKLIRLHM